MSFKIFLSPVDGSHLPIELKHKEKVIIGRSRETGIVNNKVSRNQVELFADCGHEPVVQLKLLGKHSSTLNGRNLENGESYVMKEEDILSLLKAEYNYKLLKLLIEKENKISCKRTFINENPSDDNQPTPKRRKIDNNKERLTESHDNAEGGADDDELLRVRSVEEKLLKMKQNFAVSSTTKGRIESDVFEKSKFPPVVRENKSWCNEDKLLIFHSKDLSASEKVASFDLDGTIITTQSGKVFPTSTHDWKFLLPEVPGRLKELHRNGYKIVFFSNQMGLSKGKVKISDFKSKVEDILLKIGVPVQFFIASGPGLFRKPCRGMWERLKDQENDGIEIDMKRSFFVGDAAGRPKDWLPGKKKDFSCGDRLFALNIGLTFETPEEFFLRHKPGKFNLPDFDPRSLILNEQLLKDPNSKLTSDKQELIIFVGYPASGKSHFVTKHLESNGYVHVNRDTLGSWQKCIKKTEEALKVGKSVAIDNTNPDKESRARFVSVAKAMKVGCRCFVMATTHQHSLHNERFREMTDKQHQNVSEIIFNTYRSKFEEPNTAEGFDEVVSVNFVPQFSSDADEKLYKQFLLEK